MDGFDMGIIEIVRKKGSKLLGEVSYYGAASMDIFCVLRIAGQNLIPFVVHRCIIWREGSKGKIEDSIFQGRIKVQEIFPCS